MCAIRDELVVDLRLRVGALQIWWLWPPGNKVGSRCTQLCRTATLYCTLSSVGQGVGGVSFSIGEIWSNLRVPLTIRTAAF